MLEIVHVLNIYYLWFIFAPLVGRIRSKTLIARRRKLKLLLRIICLVGRNLRIVAPRLAVKRLAEAVLLLSGTYLLLKRGGAAPLVGHNHGRVLPPLRAALRRGSSRARVSSIITPLGLILRRGF